MIIFEIFALAFKSLRTNKVRSFLTMLGIIIGVMAVILLISIGSGLQNCITQEFESLGANTIYVMPGKMLSDEGGLTAGGAPNFAGSKLELDYVKDIRKLTDTVIDAGAGIEIPISIKYGNISKYGKAQGYSENFSQLYNIKVVSGRTLNKNDIESRRKVAVLGYGLKNKFFENINPLGKKILVGDVRYEIVGLAQEKGGLGGSDIDNAAFIPITCAQDQFGMDTVMFITASAKNKEVIEEAKLQIKRYLLKKNLKEDDFTVIDQTSLVSSINQILGVLTVALGGIAAISLLVGGIGIMNIMLVSVTERTREIGLRKAVGAKFEDILFQFLIEAITLCLFGGSIGILIGAGGSLIAQKFIPASVPFWAVALAFSFSAAVGIIFGVAPAYKAAKLDPINALRYE